MSISTIRPAANVNPMTETSCPPRVTTAPAAPLTSTGRTTTPGWLNIAARPATAVAPRSAAEASGRANPPSARSIASGSRTPTRPARSPFLAAAKNASTTRR
jgi:hypothetical protein